MDITQSDHKSDLQQRKKKYWINTEIYSPTIRIKVMEGQIRFGTDGWRARIGDEYTFENVIKVSLATAKYIKQNFKNCEIVIGYDTRFLSDEFAKISAKVFAHEGVKVYLSDKPCPTPAVSFFINAEKLAGGVAITASHNPYQFNGFKFREWFGGPASPETTSQIEKIVDQIAQVTELRKILDTEEFPNKIKLEDIVSTYLDSVIADSDISKVMKKVERIAFDVMNGACAGLPSKIFGKKAIEIRAERNPLFPPYGKPEPTPYTLTPLQQICKKERIDGFAFDGDGDRIFACTKNGEIIDAHRIFAILIEYITKHKKYKGKIYKTVTASDLIDKIGNYYGLEVVTTPVGFKYLIKGMMYDNAIIAGEESGGIGISYHLKERDSLFCSCLVIYHSITEKKDLRTLVKDLEKRFGKHVYIRRDFHLKDEQKQRVMEITGKIEKIDGSVVETIEKIDGLKLRFRGGGFLLVRPSGTEPVLRVYAETESNEKSEKVIKAYCKITGIG